MAKAAVFLHRSMDLFQIERVPAIGMALEAELSFSLGSDEHLLIICGMGVMTGNTVTSTNSSR